MREKEFGRLSGLDYNAVLERFPQEFAAREKEGKYWYRFPGGENYPDVEMRVHSFLEHLSSDFASRSVLIVTHQVIFFFFCFFVHFKFNFLFYVFYLNFFFFILSLLLKVPYKMFNAVIYRLNEKEVLNLEAVHNCGIQVKFYNRNKQIKEEKNEKQNINFNLIQNYN